MSSVDWVVLVGWLAFIVIYGVWRGGKSRDMKGYVLAGREMGWTTITLSIMATQASAITFLSTPGQAYTDGMRFVQFYLGLPIAMILIAAFVVPHYHRLNILTAYEFLENRFDVKTRTLTAFLFLIQRGLAAGLTIFAPALILSVILNWDLHLTILVIGGAVVIFTTTGGTRAVSRTHALQMAVILIGMVAAGIVLVRSLGEGVSAFDALRVAGVAGRLKAIDLSFDPNNRFTLWSGLIGGFFLMLSYFGTDQSQVQRYLTGRSVTESRMGLLANGMVKVPMQFVILLLGALLFGFYQFHTPPVFFNPVEVAKVRATSDGERFALVEERYRVAIGERTNAARELIQAERSSDANRIVSAKAAYRAAAAQAEGERKQAIDLIKQHDGRVNPDDTNYVFLSFVVAHLPMGLVGLVLAAVFAASMNSCSAELNALASTTVVDIYRRLFRPQASEQHAVWASKAATVFWGAFAIAFAEFANRLGSLVVAVNVLGSLFYGTILGVFVLAFVARKTAGTAVFTGAIVAEACVLICYATTKISFLWFNLLGCILVIMIALIINRFIEQTKQQT